MKKRKKQSNIPIHKRMSRDSRLQAAKYWIDKYEGNNIVRGYSNHFAVDKLCAVRELQQLGISISEEYIELLKASEEGSIKARRNKRLKKDEDSPMLYNESDDRFYYIAGYTSAGIPYGITWEEVNEELIDCFDKNDYEDVICDIEDEELPF